MFGWFKYEPFRPIGQVLVVYLLLIYTQTKWKKHKIDHWTINICSRSGTFFTSTCTLYNWQIDLKEVHSSCFGIFVRFLDSSGFIHLNALKKNKHIDLYIFLPILIPLLIPYQYKLVFCKINYFETEKRTPLNRPLVAEVSCCIKDILVAFGCCLLFCGVVVSLTQSPFPFWISS